MSRARPNLFNYATSELSQDAFLCWLLEWADARQRVLDPELQRVARLFLERVLGAAGCLPPAPDAPIVVHAQLKSADVVAEIGDQFVLVIEDKVGTANHSDQLHRYRAALGQCYADRQLACVYLKTGDQSCYRDVRAKGWAVFRRTDLLDVLREGSEVRHDVFRDFHAYLEAIEAEVNRYQTVAPSKWFPGDAAYTGLYRALQDALDAGNWDWVNNPSGGFRGFWWARNEVSGGTIYLQLKEHELVIKIAVEDKSRQSALRDRWWRCLVDGLAGFRRPKRLGHGRYMTIATSTRDYRITHPDSGLLDLEATAAQLHRTAAELAAFVKRADA